MPNILGLGRGYRQSGLSKNHNATSIEGGAITRGLRRRGLGVPVQSLKTGRLACEDGSRYGRSPGNHPQSHPYVL